MSPPTKPLLKVGTCSWTDPTLLASGFYPPQADTAEKRLLFYASRFPVVEVDSTFYAPPSESVAGLWAARTPPEFTFDIKAYGLLTTHGSLTRSLPKAVRALLPESIAAKSRVYLKDLPENAQQLLWEMFTGALLPLDSAGKLGAVLFQFPPWFTPRRDNRDYILHCQERLGQYRMAVEFRNALWLLPERQERTLSFLREHGLAYVGVDEPQGFSSSVPPVAETTSPDLAIVRFHGRNAEAWEKKNVSVQEKFDYFYEESDLAEWTPRVLHLAEEAKEVHVLFNNCVGDKAVLNAQQMQDMLL